MAVYKIKPLLEDGGQGGSTVVANPELSGDEASLTGLEVDGTKYKVESGSSAGSLLPLVIYAKGGNAYMMSISTLVDVDNIETYGDLANYLQSKGYVINSTTNLPMPLIASGQDSEYGACTGLVYDDSKIYTIDNGSLVEVTDDEDFSITYLN